MRYQKLNPNNLSTHDLSILVNFVIGRGKGKFFLNLFLNNNDSYVITIIIITVEDIITQH